MSDGPDDLVERLVADLRPVPRHMPARVLALGLAAGMVPAAFITVEWLGLRPDYPSALATASFWMKFAYTLVLAGSGLAAAYALARPDGQAPRAPLVLGAALLAASALTALELATASPGERQALVMGSTALVCPRNILAVALPLLIGLLIALRRLAPTRPTLAGTAAGVAAGAAGAWVYAFHCPESAATFMTLWYTLGIAATAALGAAAGRFLLRW